jgi:hypothetical protein
MFAELDDTPADEAMPDVLDLTEAMAAPAPPPPRPAPGFRTIEGAFDSVFTTKPKPPPLIDRGLISNETIAAVDSAFNTLANTIIGQKARTLEDLVKEMLRPMLKSWLDDNLPSLVERIVRVDTDISCSSFQKQRLACVRISSPGRLLAVPERRAGSALYFPVMPALVAGVQVFMTLRW